MQFIVDHAVPLSAIVLLVLVLASLAVLGIAALRLWRAVRVVQRRVSAAGAELAAEGERLSQAVERMPERQAELQGAIRSLQARVDALTVLAQTAANASAVLRSPLRYLTGR